MRAPQPLAVAAESRPLRQVPLAGPVRSWSLWQLVLGAAATSAAVVAGWAVGTVRRPRGHDVVSRMSYRERSPRPAPGQEPRTPVVDYLRAGPGQTVVLMRRAVQRAQEQGDVTVQVPLLVVRGSRDEVCTQAWCEQLVASTAGSRLVVVEDSAHGIAYDAPPELVDLLLSEVEAADRAGGTARHG